MLRTKFPALPAYCNRLYKEICLLEDASNQFHLYTVQHATRVMLSPILTGHVVKLVELAGSLKRWFDDQDHPIDDSPGTIADITEEIINESNIIDSDANSYLNENETDVRDILNTDELTKNVGALEYVLMFSELHKCSSSITLLQGCAIKLLDGVIKDLVVKAQAYILSDSTEPADTWAYRDELLKKFNAWDEPLKADEVPPPSVYLKFVQHEQQVVFSESEREQTAADKQRAETEAREKAELDAAMNYAKIYVNEMRTISEPLGLAWKTKAPVSMETCKEIETIYTACQALTKEGTIAAALKVISDVLRTREPYYFTTTIPAASALFVNTIGDGKLVLLTMDSHEEISPDVTLNEEMSELVMICLR